MNAATVTIIERDDLTPGHPNATKPRQLPDHGVVPRTPASHRRLSKRDHRPLSLLSKESNPEPRFLHTLEKRQKFCDTFYLPCCGINLFGQIPAAWQGDAAEGPSAAEIAESTTAQQAFQVSNESNPVCLKC